MDKGHSNKSMKDSEEKKEKKECPNCKKWFDGDHASNECTKKSDVFYPPQTSPPQREEE